jgi:hypothetical protein
VKTAARTTARKWGEVLEVDDAEQEIWLRILADGRRQLDVLLEMDRPARIAALTKVGSRIGAEVRDEYEMFSGNYSYGTDDVRELLDKGILVAADDDFSDGAPLWELPGYVLGQLNRTDTCGANERIDVLLGMKQLLKESSWYAQILIANFTTPDPVHAHRRELTRAIDALTREMNRISQKRMADYEGIGKR